MWNDLKLTEDQNGKLKALHEEMMTVRNKHYAAVKAVRLKIKDELLKDAPSRTVLYDFAGELGELHKQMSKERGDHLLKVKTILTAEQFSKIIDKDLNKKECGSMHDGKGCNGCKRGKDNGAMGCAHQGTGKGHCKGAQDDTSSAK